MGVIVTPAEAAAEAAATKRGRGHKEDRFVPAVQHHALPGLGRPLPKAQMTTPTNNRALLPLIGGVGNQETLGSCFPVGTPILMADGTERPIEEVAEGNEVLTHNGKRRRVVHTMRRKYEGRMYTIELGGYRYPTTMTAEHPVCVYRNASSRAKYTGKNWAYEPGEMVWVAAKDLQPSDYVLMPANLRKEEARALQMLRVSDFVDGDCVERDGRTRVVNGRATHSILSSVMLDEKLARLIGFFLAEGSFRKFDGSIVGMQLTFHRKESEYHRFVIDAVRDVFGAEAFLVETEQRPNATDVRIDNSTLGRFFYGLCGEHALHKHVPSVLYSASREVRIAAIRGWLQGDGTQKFIYETNVQVMGITSSEQLHRGMYRLCMSCGIRPSVTIRSQEEHQNAPARTLSLYGPNIYAVFPEIEERVLAAGRNVTDRKRYYECDLGFVCRIKSIEVAETEEEIDVYNLEVEGEHTYIANNMAVHNCVAWTYWRDVLGLGLAGQTGTAWILSAMAGYVNSLKLTNMINGLPNTAPISDDGLEPTIAVMALYKDGPSLESEWPYDVGSFPNVTENANQAAAASQRIQLVNNVYAGIGTTGQALLDAIAQALQPLPDGRIGRAVGSDIASSWPAYDNATGADVLGPPPSGVSIDHDVSYIDVRLNASGQYEFLQLGHWGGGPSDWAPQCEVPGCCWVSEAFVLGMAALGASYRLINVELASKS
jgi:intein/homing endonuclease